MGITPPVLGLALALHGQKYYDKYVGTKPVQAGIRCTAANVIAMAVEQVGNKGKSPVSSLLLRVPMPGLATTQKTIQTSTKSKPPILL